MKTEVSRRAVIAGAAAAGAGRPSVSDVVREILDRHRAELEAEARGEPGR